MHSNLWGMSHYHTIFLQPLAMCAWSNELILARPWPVQRLFTDLKGFNEVSGKGCQDSCQEKMS